MSVLKCSLVKREEMQRNVLKALAVIISVSNPHVIFRSKTTPRCFMWSTNGMSHPFNVWWSVLVYDNERNGWPESYLHWFLCSSTHTM